MRDHQAYKKVLRNREYMKARGQFSVEDAPGAKVAIMMPFVPSLVQDPRDDYEFYESDAASLVGHYRSIDRVPVTFMRATPDDFARVLADRTIPTVVVRGTGTLSSVATPLERTDDRSYGFLDWLHAAKMATHLKVGSTIMRVCGRMQRRFNPPWPVGFSASFANIYAPVGEVISMANLEEPDNKLIRRVSSSDELSYQEVKDTFRVSRQWNVTTGVPDSVYIAARDVYNQTLNTMLLARPVPKHIPYGEYRSGIDP
ncbi:hypothetical protein GCM10027053_20320 [Intrasporangium mesophilum]